MRCLSQNRHPSLRSLRSPVQKSVFAPSCRVEGSRLHFWTSMPEDFDRLVELLNFERLFQHRYWTDLQDAIENLAIGITRNNDYVKIRIDLFRRPIDLVARSVRELQIEEHQIELLFSKAYDRVFSGSDYDAAESNLLQEVTK